MKSLKRVLCNVCFVEVKCLGVIDMVKNNKKFFFFGWLCGIGIGYVLGIAFMLAINPNFTWVP